MCDLFSCSRWRRKITDECNREKLEITWEDGATGLCIPKLDFIMLVVWELKQEKALGFYYSLLKSPSLVPRLWKFLDHLIIIEELSCSVTKMSNVNPQHHITIASIGLDINVGMYWLVIGSRGVCTKSGDGREFARPLSELVRLKCTWSAPVSTLTKYLRFCDDDLLSPLPATEQDVLAYIASISILKWDGKWKISPEYIDSVSQYHIMHHIPSTALSSLFIALIYVSCH